METLQSRRPLPLALLFIVVTGALYVKPTAGRSGRALVGQVQRFEGQLDAALGNPATQDGAGLKQQEGDVSRPWWATSEEVLTRVLQREQVKFIHNLETRAHDPNLRLFLRDPESSETPRLYIDAIMTPTYQCADEVRLGAWVLWAHWVCLSHYGALSRDPPLVLSLGELRDTSFAQDVFREIGAVSHVADFGYNPVSVANARSLESVQVHEVTVSGSKDARMYQETLRGANVVSLSDLVTDIGAKYVDILKIDCEGCEHGIIDDLSTLFTRESVPVGQILVQFHIPEMRMRRTFESLARLEDLGFRLFHSEIVRFNNKAPENFHYNVALIHDNLVQPRGPQL